MFNINYIKLWFTKTKENQKYTNRIQCIINKKIIQSKARNYARIGRGFICPLQVEEM